MLFLVFDHEIILRRCPHHLKAHNGMHELGIEVRPFRLVNDRRDDLEGCVLCIGRYCEAAPGHGSNPVQPRRCDSGMKIVDLLSPGDRRAFKEGKSYVGKRARMLLAGRKILALHKGKIRAWRTERYAVPLIVGAHTGKCIAASHVSLEVINA